MNGVNPPNTLCKYEYQQQKSFLIKYNHPIKVSTTNKIALPKNKIKCFCNISLEINFSDSIFTFNKVGILLLYLSSFLLSFSINLPTK